MSLLLFIYTRMCDGATKSIVSELNKGYKLNDDNFYLWHRKIQLILKEQVLIEGP